MSILFPTLGNQLIGEACNIKHIDDYIHEPSETSVPQPPPLPPRHQLSYDDTCLQTPLSAASVQQTSIYDYTHLTTLEQLQRRPPSTGNDGIYYVSDHLSTSTGRHSDVPPPLPERPSDELYELEVLSVTSIISWQVVVLCKIH